MGRSPYCGRHHSQAGILHCTCGEGELSSSPQSYPLLPDCGGKVSSYLILPLREMAPLSCKLKTFLSQDTFVRVFLFLATGKANKTVAMVPHPVFYPSNLEVLLSCCHYSLREPSTFPAPLPTCNQILTLYTVYFYYLEGMGFSN